METSDLTAFSTSVARFEVRHTRYLAASGEVMVDSLPDWARDPEVLLPILRAMVLTRAFDRKALNLQRTGQLGTYGSPLGQEAIGAAVASAMRRDDVLLPSYREFSAQLYRGVTPLELLLYWGGDERGNDFQGPREDFPICIPIASHACHAAGVACAFKLRQQPRVAVCCMGDGATSKGDFYEALNAAGIWRLPMVVVISNNQWAISVPRERQTAAQTLAQKSIAAGVPGEQVDGNDALAVRDLALRALEHARSGKGPYVIEALTFRIGDHTTADDASRYRDPEVVQAHRQADPLRRFASYLRAAGIWSEERQKALDGECDRQIDAAVAAYLKIPAQAPESMFEHLYAEMPAAIRRQRASLSGTSDG